MRRNKHGHIITLIAVLSLLLAMTVVTTARPQLQDAGPKSEHFCFPALPDVYNFSLGAAVSVEAGDDYLQVHAVPLGENRNAGRITSDNFLSPLGAPLTQGSGYLNLSGNFSTLWQQSMTANHTGADVIFDVDGDDNPDVLVFTTAYDAGTDTETKKVIVKKGTNGTHLWEQAVSAQGHDNCNIFIDWFVDLDGDNLDDAFVIESEYNQTSELWTKHLIAKRGYDGMHLWNQTVNGTECGIAADWVLNLDEDPLDEVIVSERSYNAATGIETKKLIAKDGNNGTHLWEQTVTATGYQISSIWVDWATDLDGDGLDDVLLRIREYNVSDDIESVTERALKGTDGTILWSQTLRDTEVSLWLYLAGDLDGDDLEDVLIEEWSYNESANLTTGYLRAKKGLDGSPLWNQSVQAAGYDNCAIWYDGIADLNGDNVTDVLVSSYNYSEALNTSTSMVVAKNGLNGTHLWEQSVQTPGRATCIKFVRWIIDLSGDGLDDIVVFEQLVNESANTVSSKMIAKQGFNGTHLWEQSITGTESDIWMLGDDLDGDNLMDAVFRGWSYNESSDTVFSMVIARRGTDGMKLWEQNVTGTESDIWAQIVGDLDGDNLTDVVVSAWSYNESANLENVTVTAKNGLYGNHLWAQSVAETECDAGVQFTIDLDGDDLDDALLYVWTYNESLDLDTKKLIAKKGNNGSQLWEESVNASGRMNTDIWALWTLDLDGDELNDVIVIEWVLNTSAQTVMLKVVAKKGTNGTQFWAQSVSGTHIGLWIWTGSDLDGDALPDFIINRGSYTESTNATSVILTAKRGYDGMHFWEQSVNCTGQWWCDIWLDTLADLDGDDLDDAVVIERAYNESANATLDRLVAKRGYDGLHFFEAESNEPIWTASWLGGYNLDGVGLNDLLLGSSTEMYAVTYRVSYLNLFDTGEPALPYPSIGGTFTGTLTPHQNLSVHTLHVYPCMGTGGHGEYVRIWGDGVDVNATWSGYSDDWQNLIFSEPFATLMANTTYNITIELGSYPQLIHEGSVNVTGGALACNTYEDLNGIIYNELIPAMRIT